MSSIQEILKQAQPHTYWETLKEFLAKVIKILQLDENEILMEAGSGKGFAACQFAYETHIHKIIGIEKVKDRHEAAKETLKTITEIAARNQRQITPLEFIYNDFRSENIGSFIEMSTVMFCALNSDEGIKKFLERLLQHKKEGFRICTNLTIYDFEFSAQDPRIQVLQILSKSLNEPNTTMRKTFVPFFIYSVRLKPIAEFGADNAIQHVAGDQVFLSLQIGLGWAALEGRVIEAKLTHSLVETALPTVPDLILRIWLPNNEIFTNHNECDQETVSRNRTEPDENEQVTPMPSPDHNISALPFVSPEVAEALELTPESIKYIRENYEHGQHRFDIVHSEEETAEYFKTRNPKFEFPCKCTAAASPALKYKLPSEPMTCLSSIYGDKDRRIHVVVTHKNFNVTYSKVTIQEMENHLKRPEGNRRAVWTMPNIVVMEKDRSTMKPPKALRYYDKDGNRQIGVPDDEDTPYQMLDLTCTMSAKGSLRPFRCDSDGAVIWLTVTEGTLLFFIVLDPNPEDFTFLRPSEEGSLKKKFIGDSMKGRVVCVDVGRGETLIFPSNLPHAWYTCKDVLSYGGRYLMPSRLEFNLEFSSKNPQTCSESGYTHINLVQMIYKGLGNVWYILWKMKILDSNRFHEEGNQVLDMISYLLFHCKMMLTLTDEQVEWTNTFFQALVIEGGSTFVQSLYGVFYPMDSQEQMKQVFKRIVKGKTFFPALTNVTDGLSFRKMTLPDKKEMDFDHKGDYRNLELSDVVPRLLTHTPPAFVGICQRKFGMFATCNLKKNQRVALFTGHIRSESGLKKRYGHGRPPGKVYFLNEYVSKRGKVKNVYIDANYFGSFSLFVKHSDSPNCVLQKFSVKKRVILIVVTDAEIASGDELLVPRPTFYTPERDTLFSIDDYILGDEGVPSKDVSQQSTPAQATTSTSRIRLETPYERSPYHLRHGRSKPRVLKPLQKSKLAKPPGPDINEPEVADPSAQREEEVADDSTQREEEVADDSTHREKEVADDSTHREQEVADDSTHREQEVVDDEREPEGEQEVADDEREREPEGEQEVADSTGVSGQEDKPEESEVQPTVTHRREDRVVEDDQVPGPSRRSPTPSDPIPDTHGSTVPRKGRKPSKKPKKPRKKGKPAIPKKNERDVHVLLSSPEDSDEWEGGTPSGTFEIDNVAHEAHHVSHYPNPLILPIYRDLTPAQQQALVNIAVALIYPEFEHYVKMNERLLRMYNQKLDKKRPACAVCAHFGYPIDGFPDEVFHKFDRPQLYRYHHERYHKELIKCETCKKDFKSAKQRDGHYRSMLNLKHPGHVADAAKRAEKRKEEAELKAKKKEERQKKKEEKDKKRAEREKKKRLKVARSCAQEALAPPSDEEDEEDDEYDEGTQEESEGETNDEPPSQGPRKRKRGN